MFGYFKRIRDRKFLRAVLKHRHEFLKVFFWLGHDNPWGLIHSFTDEKILKHMLKGKYIRQIYSYQYDISWERKETRSEFFAFFQKYTPTKLTK